MSLDKIRAESVLSAARTLIGTPYKDLDCSYFVHKAYAIAGFHYAYQATATFHTLVGKCFEEVVDMKACEAADVLMFSGHMGLWDAQGCKVLEDAKTPNQECIRFKNNLPFLSSRSGGGRGPDFGQMKWFGGLKKVYRWKS